MKIGFLTACLPDMPLDTLVPWAAEQGFKALELAAWPVESDRDYQARQIDAANFTKEDAEKCRTLFSEFQADPCYSEGSGGPFQA